MNIHENGLHWFEIPVTDMQRARHFYQVVFGIHMEEKYTMDRHLAYFPTIPGNGKATGALVQGGGGKPGRDGVMIYLNADPNLQFSLDLVESVGGKIIKPKTLIDPEIGYMAIIADTEGNEVGLQSFK